MVPGMLGDSASDTSRSRHGFAKDVRAEWAEEQYTRALGKLVRIIPVGSLDALKQGDVMFSKSGNVRLVLDVERKISDTEVTFLSRLKTGNLRVESAMLHRIDRSKLDALVVRRDGNPLEKFAPIAKALQSEEIVFYNITVLLQMGALGGRLSAAFSQHKRDQYGFVTVGLQLSSHAGKIEEIGEPEKPEGRALVKLSFNCLRLPAEDYIRTATFVGKAEPGAKVNLIAACVCTNTLENARNFVHMAQMARM
jgi:hypothetical protein